MLTYTIPGPRTEGDVSVGMSSDTVLRQEPVRVELVWVGEQIRLAMQVVDMYMAKCSGWY